MGNKQTNTHGDTGQCTQVSLAVEGEGQME